ncbi:MAG: DUF3494 domain-containing protein [Bacteroidetes bacterium]|nr:MAG: DUF3494 domain-containing protein [Bacteroidota bacterium]
MKMKFLNGISLLVVLSMLFATSCNDDDSEPSYDAPTVTETSPDDNALDISVSGIITASFSEAMDPASINESTFTLMEGTNTVSGVITYEASKAIFTPTNNLSENEVFTATITTGAKSSNDVALESDYIFSFTTGSAPDIIPPEVSSTVPLNNATGVSRNQVIKAYFSEEMTSSTINSTTFLLKNGANAVEGSVAYAGTMATFTPSEFLLADVTYTAIITTGAKDLAGNPLVENKEWTFKTGGTALALDAVDLKSAANFVILAKSAITNVPTSDITGDVALSPAAASDISGLALVAVGDHATSSQVTGLVFAADMDVPTPITLTTAVEDMIAAYNDAAGRPTPDFSELGTGDLGGKTLLPGLYKWTSTVSAPSDFTIAGGENDVWIFQISGDLSLSSAAKIILSGGAQAKNIFWQVAGSVELGATSHFEGVIICQTGITLLTGATMNGRAFAQTAVVLDSNVVSEP